MYTVVWEGTVRESYEVEASSEEEARLIWSDYPFPVSSESMDGEVVEVREE